MLKNKSIHDLRGIAQSFEIANIFSMDEAQLRQAIELKQNELIPEPEIVLPRPEYDARLMTRPPSKKGSEGEIRELLTTHVKRGLHLSFPEPEQWHMQFGKREDTGTCRQKLSVILRCAEKIMKV